MSYWVDFGAWKERDRELVREAERGRRARELREARGAREIRAGALPHTDYPREASCGRRGGEWRSDALWAREVRGTHSAGERLRDFIAVAGTLFVPFSRVFRGR